MTKSAEGVTTVTGEIVAFPLFGRTSLIRRCAAELEALHGDPAVVYWRAACRALAADLAALGSAEIDIHHQVMDFQTEVQLEMMRRYTDRLEGGVETEHRART